MDLMDTGCLGKIQTCGRNWKVDRDKVAWVCICCMLVYYLRIKIILFWMLVASQLKFRSSLITLHYHCHCDKILIGNLRADLQCFWICLFLKNYFANAVLYTHIKFKPRFLKFSNLTVVTESALPVLLILLSKRSPLSDATEVQVWNRGGQLWLDRLLNEKNREVIWDGRHILILWTGNTRLPWQSLVLSLCSIAAAESSGDTWLGKFFFRKIR